MAPEFPTNYWLHVMTFLETSPWALASSPTGREDLTGHIAAELRRMVERVEVEKGEPVKVIPRSED